MDADEPDPLRTGWRVDVDPSAGRERPVVLRDLVALREIRIKVVLPSEAGVRVDGGADGERQPHRERHGSADQDRKSSRETDTHGTGRDKGGWADGHRARDEEPRSAQA